MSTPTTTFEQLQPEFEGPDANGGYVVRLGPTVVGYVARCRNNPRVWEAWTDHHRNYLRGQRSTRELAARHLVRQTPTRAVEIPDEAIELMARVLSGQRAPVAASAWDHLRNVVALPTAITVAHQFRLAAHDVHDIYPRFSAWLEQRADEIDGGQ